ncbi:hypothetical protein PCA10_29570 [Metapseudomonas resinovorans NBRC 106553]|uniref:Uncharacterized protein n=1 Tax=Metapseudomonas resinovorans NBRC 106553 TaxID=1245471 RepID=S6BHT6_METRE|nr:hypothetical protein PCA10_29570 [Pseudomonas resinovorans NBRC 106553]
MALCQAAVTTGRRRVQQMEGHGTEYHPLNQLFDMADDFACGLLIATPANTGVQ